MKRHVVIAEMVKPHSVRDPYRNRFKVGNFWSVRKVCVQIWLVAFQQQLEPLVSDVLPSLTRATKPFNFRVSS